MDTSGLSSSALNIIAGATAIVLGLKAFVMARDCYIVQRLSSAHELSYDWPGTTALQAVHLNRLFRFPILVVAMSAWLACDALSVWLVAIGSGLVFVTIWIQILQAFVTRLTFGFSDIHVRHKSVVGSNDALQAAISQREVARDLILFISGLAMTTIVGYAGIYRALQRLITGQFTGHIDGFMDCIYFSTVTFATVGYGDIAPLGIARVVTVTEIFASMGCVVLLVLAYSMTAVKE